jgi:preprotein translocase subunit YajC
MISTAWAQGTVAAGTDINSAIMGAVPFILVFAIFYFFVMRPQMTAAKKHSALVAGLKKGDVVVTDGGLIGEISSIKENLVHVRLGGDTVVTFAREAVRTTLVGEAAKGWEAKAEAKKK